MNLSEKRERWARMLAQAAQFAELENTLDAAERAKACLREIEAALGLAADTPTREALGEMRARTERRVGEYAELHRKWMDGVRAREKSFRDREQEVYAKPLPLPGID